MLVFAGPQMPMSSVPARQLGSVVALGGRVLVVLGVAFSVGEGDLGTAGGGESAVNDVKFDKCERERRKV